MVNLSSQDHNQSVINVRQMTDDCTLFWSLIYCTCVSTFVHLRAVDIQVTKYVYMYNVYIACLINDAGVAVESGQTTEGGFSHNSHLAYPQQLVLIYM